MLRRLLGSTSSSAHQYAAVALRAGVGVAILILLLWRYDARTTLHIIRRERPEYFIATVAIYLACQVVSAYRWRLLAGVLNLRGPFSEFVRYYFIGGFTNRFTPGVLAGDAARAFYLGRRHDRMGEAIASTVADRGYGLLALFWFAAAIALAVNRGTLTPDLFRTVVAIGLISFAMYLASPLLVSVRHLMPRPIRRALGIISPYLSEPMAALPAIGLSMVIQTLLAVCQYVLALGLGLHLPVSIFLLIVPISAVITSLPFTINGMGLRETAYLYLFRTTGVSHGDAIALGLLLFAATMIGGLVGAIAFVATDLPTFSSPPIQPDAEAGRDRLDKAATRERAR
jgi:glycosyltransferase 2 family protein